MADMEQRAGGIVANGRTWAQKAVTVSLAGRLAERKGGAPDAQGWRPLLSDSYRIALHEAAHAVAARAVGWYPEELVICRDDAELKFLENGQVVRGYAAYSTTPVMPARDTPTESRWSDRHQIAMLCLTMAGEWRSAVSLIHRLRAETSALIDLHWEAVRHLASELDIRKTVGRSRIDEILDRYFPAEQGVATE
jgi:hypothetical protein